MVNTEKALQWMYNKKGNVAYSMENRNGPNSYDCSSAVYYALRDGGASNNGWAVNTEYEHDWLIANGYRCVAENTAWSAERGDVFIWGQRGYSAGAGGHTGMFVDSDNIIHCNWGYNGITVNNHDWLWGINGNPYFYAYRYFGDTDNTSTDSNDGDVTSVAREVLAGDWGNGQERIDRLTEAGYDADAVQREVNRLVSGQSSIDLELIAREVLAGDWGNGQERIDRLTAAGYDYQEIQDIVNSWL